MTARLNASAAATPDEFQIGATPAATAANLRASMDLLARRRRIRPCAAHPRLRWRRTSSRRGRAPTATIFLPASRRRSQRPQPPSRQMAHARRSPSIVERIRQTRPFLPCRLPQTPFAVRFLPVSRMGLRSAPACAPMRKPSGCPGVAGGVRDRRLQAAGQSHLGTTACDPE